MPLYEGESYPPAPELKQAKKKKIRKKKIKVKHQETKVQTIQNQPKQFPHAQRFFPPTLNSKVKNGLIPEGMKDDLADTYLTHTDTLKKKKD